MTPLSFARQGGLTALLAASLLLMAGCGGSRRVRKEAPPPPPEVVVDYRSGEDFDASPYREAPPADTLDVAHDVPEELMDGKASARPTARIGRGYRIQVFSTPNKSEADRRAAQLIQWWQSNRAAAGSLFRGTQAPVYTVYLQPYYRVRIGNFETRAQAQQALGGVAQEFPGALIVPDRVTLVR